MQQHHRATLSIPKFGAWNEADPRSGGGFTAIFEKVKQEKQIASTNFPTTTVPQQACNYMNGTDQTKRRTSSTSKVHLFTCICTCMRLYHNFNKALRTLMLTYIIS